MDVLWTLSSQAAHEEKPQWSVKLDGQEGQITGHHCRANGTELAKNVYFEVINGRDTTDVIQKLLRLTATNFDLKVIRRPPGAANFFSAQEDATIVQKRREGLDPEAIAALLPGRSGNSVRERLEQAKRSASRRSA